MKNAVQKYLLLSLSALVLAACQTQTTSMSQEASNGETVSQEAAADASQRASGAAPATQLGSVEIDEEAWKNEPAYGTEINVLSQSGCSAVINVAGEMGYYEDEGLDVNLFVNQSTPMEAVGTGQAALGSEHLTSSLVPMTKDVNVQYVGGMHTGCKALYVGGDSGIESVADLEGKTIGIHDGIGLSDQNIAMRFLQDEGIDVNKVKFVTTDTAASIQAIENGELDGAVYAENYAAPFEEDGRIKSLRSITFDEDYKDEICCTLFVNKDFARDNPITTKKLMRAIYKANAFAVNDMEGYVDFLFANDLISGDRDAGFEFISSLEYGVTEQQMEDTIIEVTKDYQELGIIDENKTVDQVLEQVWGPTGLEIPDTY